MSDYEILTVIGEGNYGRVFKAKHKKTGRLVALKKVKMEQEKQGFPITAIREIKLLQNMKHRNIVQLLDIAMSKASDYNKMKGNVYMVFEYAEHDLNGLLHAPQVRLTDEHVRVFMYQLLEGLCYIHTNKILHRDLKGANVLVSNDGTLKIADWGLARSYIDSEQQRLTVKVVTRWYRAPELLLGDEHYGPAVDMWSAGCIFAELLCRQPLFPGRDDADQLRRIFHVCGTPTADSWPGHDKLPGWGAARPAHALPSRMDRAFTNSRIHPLALKLLKSLLTLDPARRLSAADALDADYFWTGAAMPKAADLEPLSDVSLNELATKKRMRREHEQRAAAAKRQKKGHHHHHHRSGGGGGGAGGAGGAGGGSAGSHGRPRSRPPPLPPGKRPAAKGPPPLPPGRPPVRRLSSAGGALPPPLPPGKPPSKASRPPPLPPGLPPGKRPPP
eukprot:PLAT10381.1.p1 GENE.PLAT10381.1~~PLAT10381.1.p1  ORF type:complete len:445 (+),score=131.21 PLAT10381.1:746-2080(+)